MKLAVITGFLGKTKDRFHEYNEALDLDAKFGLLASIPGYSGVEVVHPYEVPAAAELKALLAKHGLSVAAINVNVKAEPEFRSGGLTSADPTVRAKAVRFLKEAKDYAAAVGADKVTCCPLGDGYEFAFQYDYAAAWRQLVDAFAEAAAHRPEVTLFVEYKPSETRGRCFVDSAAKTLCLIRDAGTKGLGVTLDFGHSVYGGENAAEAAALVHSERSAPVHPHQRQRRQVGLGLFLRNQALPGVRRVPVVSSPHRVRRLVHLGHQPDPLGRGGHLRGQRQAYAPDREASGPPGFEGPRGPHGRIGAIWTPGSCWRPRFSAFRTEYPLKETTMAKPKVYVTRRIPEAGLELLRRECEVEVSPHDRPLTRPEFLAAIRGRDGVICLLTDKVDAEAFEAAAGVKGFANYAVGFDNLDVAEATRRRIPLSNTPDVLTDATADMAWALLFAVARRVVESDGD